MILAATALGQAPFGGGGSGASVNFIELAASISAAFSIQSLIALENAPVGITYYPPVIDRPSNLFIAANNKKALSTTALTESGETLTLDNVSTWPSSGVVTLDYALTAARTPTSSEIVYFTGRSGNVLNIGNRAQGGTTAKAWPIGTSAEMRHTAEYHNLIRDCIIALQTELTAVEAELIASIDSTNAGVAAVDAAKVSKSGDAMTGALTLANPPTTSLHAVNKAYVDSVMPTVWNAKSYGVMGNGTTDDTAAIIALMTTVFNAGGGRIYFPRGKYIIGGPFQSSAGCVAQIPLPLLEQYDTPLRGIDWVGELAPSVTLSHSGTYSGDNYTLFESTRTDGSGIASMIGTTWAPSPGAVKINALQFNITDMIFKLPANPTYTALDFTNLLSNRLTHILVYAGLLDVRNPDEPTHSNTYGVKLSPTSTSSRVDVDSFNAFGVYTAVKSGELAYGTFIAQCCKVALEVPFANFGSKFNLVGVYDCTYGVKPTGNGPCGVLIDYLSIEDGNGYWEPWMTLVYAVDDPTNLLNGRYTWELQKAGTVGTSHVLPVNGGANFIGTDLWP